MTLQRKYSWVPDIPDHRDWKYSAKITRIDLPRKVDLRIGQSEVYDQGNLGSCVANSTCAQFDYLYNKEHKSFLHPSRLFVYRGARELEGYINEDSGCMIRDAIKYLASTGVCKESTWTYDISKFADKPSIEAYNEASKFKIVKYERANSLLQMQQAAAQGYCTAFGFTVYESFESDKTARTGICTKPRKTERALGGHAVLFCGYDMDTKRALVRNSWGKEWGQGGYFWMPFTYFTKDLTDDYWVIHTTT